MRAMSDILTLISSFLCILIIFGLLKIIHKICWVPYRIQYLMGLQGIRGPSYRLLFGSTKEMMRLKMEANSKPLLGLSHNIYPYLQPYFYVWTKLYGKTFLQWIGPTPFLVITELELIKEVFNNIKAFPKAKIEDNVLKKILGGGLTTLDGEQWTKMRKIANNSFHGESLKGMIPAMVASTEAMVERWKNRVGKEIEVHEEFRLLSSEIISRTAFGSSLFEGNNIFEMLHKLTLIATRSLYNPRFPGISKVIKTEDDLESEKLEKGMRQSILEIIKKREEMVLKGNNEEISYGNDFLGVLLKAHHHPDPKERISVDDVIDECKSFYFAGHETTNSLLSWTMLLLAIHQDWQEEARKEVLEIFGKEKPNPHNISKLKTMNMIINETLRLYPPTLESPRRVDRQIKLGNLVLPRDMILYIPFLALHHDPEIWGEDVHLFKPQRFSQGVAKATNNNINAFVPFGFGPKICVGFNFALVEAKIALTMILQHYSFTVSPAYVHSPTTLLTSRPQHGVQVLLHLL